MTPIKITWRMTGKMTGMASLNDTPEENQSCLKWSQVESSICFNCYSMAMMKRYKNASKCFAKNGEILSSRLLTDDEIPKINAAFFRFHAHGELRNGTHCANFFAICRANPQTTFTLWTKKHVLVQKVIRDFGKPSNLILIKSSPIKNKREKLPEHFNKVFTVYDKSKTKGININCGDKKCIDCLTCYNLKDRKTFINEVKK